MEYTTIIIMKKRDVVNLYGLIKGAMSGKLEPEVKKNYTLLRIELIKVFKDLEEARQEITNQTKNEDKEIWNKDFQVIMNEWLSKEIELDCKVFSLDDYLIFIGANDFPGDVEDFIREIMVKDEDNEE